MIQPSWTHHRSTLDWCQMRTLTVEKSGQGMGLKLSFPFNEHSKCRSQSVKSVLQVPSGLQAAGPGSSRIQVVSHTYKN